MAIGAVVRKLVVNDGKIDNRLTITLSGVCRVVDESVAVVYMGEISGASRIPTVFVDLGCKRY